MMAAKKPNIIFFHIDNLGQGELGCYGGGILRGAETKRIDQFAQQGLKLTHYVVEAQCTPTRSALMTGRYSIRSGNHTVALAGSSGGLVAWERTMADVLTDAGYATSCVGKWHIGAEDGRWPTDHGFDEWYGPAHSYDECLWTEDPFYDPRRDPVSYMFEGTKENGVQELKDQQLTPELRINVDVEYQKRAMDFIKRSVDAEKPFFLYHNHSMMHLPNVPREEFKGKSGNGDWADCLVEMDHDFGQILDLVDEMGIADNTIVVFAGDNGPEEMQLWRGTSGFYEGSYFTSAEGGIRTPCLIRWPGKIPAGQSSNEMVHVTDMFTTLLKMAGSDVPEDRIIDGIDQTEFFLGKQENSSREGCVLFVGDQMHGVKWKDFKLMFKKQKYFFDSVPPLGFVNLINLITDPKEREPINHQHLHTWVMAHAGKILKEFQSSLKQEAPIPAGAPLDFRPDRDKK
ncbi:MAG: arylsulfatase [Candidatus Aminicenantes bacterium]|nr:MAG: arylsulfatase [Candidatus Aminicenantes bacterium]